MARKIIKAILFILAAVVVAGGIMTYLRSQKKVSTPLQTQSQPAQQPEPVKHSELKQLTVNAQGSGAQVQIKGINEHNYNIQHIETGDGFKILVPNAAIEQIQPIFDKPHPLIKKIEVHPAANNVGTAELIFHTEKDVNFLDTQKNDTLTIDFIKTESTGDEKAAATAPTTGTASKSTATAPSASTTSKSSASSLSNNKSAAQATVTPKGSKAAKAASKKQAALAARAASKAKKSKKGSSVKLKPFVVDDDTSLNDSVGSLAPDEQGGSLADIKNNQANNLNAFGDAGTPSTETIPQQQEEAPTIEPDTAAKPSADDNDGFNLKDVVKEEPKVPAGNANLLDAETQMSLTEKKDAGQQVAALPNQQIDLNKLQANLPALQNMTVARTGTSTVVTFDREKAIAFKIFRMVNPSRIVVDFKDAKSKLKTEYPRFAGTKISRIETREYAGVDGMLVRVIMYVDGAPNFTSSKNGNQLQIEVQ